MRSASSTKRFATDEPEEPGCLATYADRRAFTRSSNRTDRGVLIPIATS